MAFFGKIKRAFGLSGDDFDEEEIEGIDATVHPRQPVSAESQYIPPTADTSDIGAPVSDAVSDTASGRSTVSPDEIFSTVVKIFNESLPDFVKVGVNEEAQRKYLYDALDESLKAHLHRLGDDARELCRREWENERKKLMSESASLRDRVKAVEDTSSENKKQQLSAERQKRALAERLHDLEGKIAQLEAEKEQYELENRSLVNKLRVSNVMSDIDGDTLETIDTLNKTVESLRQENTELSAAVEQYRVKTEMSDAMINDLNSRASSAQSESAALHEEIARLQVIQADVDRRESELKDKISDLSRELDTARAELEEAHSTMDVVEEIQAELDKFEDIKAKKDSKIALLQATVKQRDERIIALEVELKSLHETVDAAASERDDNESRLNEEIARLKAKIESGTAAKEPRRRKKAPIKISAIDEDLDNTDWLVATPPEGTNARPGGVADSEFGYQEPVKKSTPENSAQMSLW